MPNLADLSLRAVVDGVAARRPSPGGGCAAAWTLALGAGLVEMAARFAETAAGREAAAPRMTEVRDEAAALRGEALALAERDATAYAPVLAALRLPRDDPERARRLREARVEASATPLGTARAAARAAVLGAELAVTGNEHLRGDAVAGAVLAEAACRAAAALVEINLGDDDGDGSASRADAARCRGIAAQARERALATVPRIDG